MALITNTNNTPTGGFAPSVVSGKHLLAQFNRPADATIYSTGDVISDSAATARAIEFRGAGSAGKILGAQILTSDGQAAVYNLLVFAEEPQNYVDNAGLSLQLADAPKLVSAYRFEGNAYGLGTFTLHRELTPYIANPAAYSTRTGSLYGLLVIRSDITPVASATYIIKLYVETY